MTRCRRWQEASLAGRGSRRTARTEFGALERASADATERIAVSLRNLRSVSRRRPSPPAPTRAARSELPPPGCRHVERSRQQHRNDGTDDLPENGYDGLCDVPLAYLSGLSGIISGPWRQGPLDTGRRTCR